MNYFEIHLVEHCNLKCKSCDNFSSIAEEEFLDEQTFANDMQRMSGLFNDNIKWMRLLGGEPLLHPNINFFLDTARDNFMKSEIRLTTNGILLTERKKDFWKCCRANNIIIEITYYPIKIDWNKIKELGQLYGVTVIYFDNQPTTIKYTHRNPVVDKKDQDINYNFSHCYQVHRCMTLKRGKVYPCTCIPNIYHFNKFFNKNLEITDKDYIDIYNNDAKEIDEFLNKPVPFCAYCNVKNRTNGHPWSFTNKKLEEWFDEEE